MATQETDRPSYYPNLDVCRHLLALEVVYLHCSTASNLPYFLPIQPVPAFVCISGLLIPASLSNSRNWKHFALKRALRVLPAFLLSFLFIAILKGPGVIPATFLFYLTVGQLGLAVNSPLWSLGLEELLYGFHALSRASRLEWRLWMPLVCLVVTCVVWTILLLGPHDPVEVCRYAGTVAAFFLGNVLSFASRRRNLWIAIGSIVGIVALNMFDTGPYIGDVATLILHFAAKSALVVLAAVCLPQIPRLPFDFSYGIYVYHYPLMTSLVALGLTGSPLLAATIGLTVAVAAASWFGVERVALRRKNAGP